MDPMTLNMINHGPGGLATLESAVYGILIPWETKFRLHGSNMYTMHLWQLHGASIHSASPQIIGTTYGLWKRWYLMILAA